VLGAEHPDTLSTRDNWAGALMREGKNADAEKEYRDVLAIRLRVLGPDHPDTLATRRNLADALALQGRYAAAENEYRSVLAIQERVLGPQHPRTLGTRANLAWCQILLRDFAGALATVEAGRKGNASDLALETDRAHALLFLGRSREAEQIYLQHRGEKVAAAFQKPWEQVILQDFDALEKAGFARPEMTRIRGLLKPGANPGSGSPP